MPLALPVGAGTEICNLVSRQHAGRLSHPTRQNNQPRYAADEAVIAATYCGTSLTELEAKHVSQVGYGRRAWHRGPTGRSGTASAQTRSALFGSCHPHRDIGFSPEQVFHAIGQ